MNQKFIYLVFSKTGTWLSRSIRLFSDTEYVHTSLSFDSSFKEMYSFGRIHPNNPFSGGFVRENLHDGLYLRPTCKCLIYKVPVTKKQYDALVREVALFCHQEKCYRYNFLGLFGVLFNYPLKRRHHYFCSQFVSELLIKTQIYETDKVPELIRTSDLFNIKDKELIYIGPVTTLRVLNESSIINPVNQAG